MRSLLPPGAAPPPGATAQCRDGTYSFSQHHSGTCSHHGGVASWLDALGSTTGVTATPASGGVVGVSTVDVGKTVLLARRSKTSGCKLGANPDRRCSPGAYYSKLTKTVICSPSFRTSTIRNVPEAEKFQVEQEYGLEPAHYGSSLEIDHIVSLELGGSNDIANLFPEKAAAHPGFRVKDKLENATHDWVCDGKIGLRYAVAGAHSEASRTATETDTTMRYEEEVLEYVGSAGAVGEFGVVVFQPHLDPDLTAIGLDTPGGRRYELDAEGALALARALERAAPALARLRAAAHEEVMAED